MEVESNEDEDEESSELDWLALSDDYRAQLVLWGRWDEVDHNVPAYLRHLRVRDSAPMQNYFDHLAERHKNGAKSETREELREKLKAFQERQELDKYRTLIARHKSTKRQILRLAPWRRGHIDPIYLKKNLLHRLRHRRWRTCTPRTVWLRRLGTKWVAADQKAANRMSK